ncbi:hypothetical protein N5853_12755 [Bartonella sp. HY329]|uniref:hypothetical protein n=1 Tax=unclassified Bartonella TaxID=2645622 RepID=UPI0021CA2644|nr:MULTISPECIES: hypothetical protein [unclassified Bartonella]UXM94941.1 hypothetical protein N5853_12755 [Bartonella sp. HY329]UXN09264.1 hypothetical protein N5852_12765 [Bartonella sp. HY328]
MRKISYVMSISGSLVFLIVFLASFTMPFLIESWGKGLIVAEVQSRVETSVKRAFDSKVNNYVARRTNLNEARIAAIDKLLKTTLPTKVQEISARMRDPSCTCRAIFNRLKTKSLITERFNLQNINEKLTNVIEVKYAEVTSGLIKEARIFSSANLLVFLALGLITWWRPKANIHLVLPIIILLGSALLVGYFYLFQQDWMHSIIFNDFVGFAYYAYLSIAIFWLIDIVLWHGFITRLIIELITSVFNHAVSVLLC